MTLKLQPEQLQALAKVLIADLASLLTTAETEINFNTSYELGGMGMNVSLTVEVPADAE